MVWSKVGEGTTHQTNDKTSNGLHTFFLYQGYDILFFGEAHCTYYYVIGVPYSCGVVLVFLVLAGNSFWCYVRT